jgi:hypothetical protein
MEFRDQELRTLGSTTQPQKKKRRFKLVRLEERIAPGGIAGPATSQIGCHTTADNCNGGYSTLSYCCGH